MHIIEGFLIGLSTLFVVGPVVFVLINATLTDGNKSGFAVAFGIFVSDFVFALLAINGLNRFLKTDFLSHYLGLIGFFILFGLGLSYLLKIETPVIGLDKIGHKTIFQNFIKGFSINFFNPFVLGFWVLLGEYGKDKYSNNALSFLMAMVFGILIIDFVKVILSKKLIPIIKSNKILLFYKIVGIIILLFSFRMLYAFVKN